MNTFFEYLEWRGDLSFESSPFNEVDAGILARLSYEPFELVMDAGFNNSISVKTAIEAILKLKGIKKKVMFGTLDINFMKAIKDSVRFGDISVRGVVSCLDQELQCQFAACVFELGNNDYYLAYRGTDKNLVAWKEDLNMGVVFPVPAQIMALEYFKDAVNNLPSGNYIIGGHSKGGNLAVYSATYADSSCQDMVKAIYNFDGPGFNENVMGMPEYKAIEDRINTFVPKFSVVGMILDHIEDYSVVNSDNVAILQHEPLSWEINRDSFVLKEKVKSGSKFIDNTMKEWLSKLDVEERSAFVDTLYEVLTAGDAKVAEDLIQVKNMARMFKGYVKMDSKTKKAFIKVLVRLFMSASSTAKTAVTSNSAVVAEKTVKRIAHKKSAT